MLKGPCPLPPRKIKLLICLGAALLLLVVMACVARADGVTDKIAYIRSQYPSDTHFTVNGKACTVQSNRCSNCQLSKINPNKTKGTLSSGKEAANVENEAWTCTGFAKYVFYNIFGIYFKDSRNTVSYSLSDARPGDYVQMWNTSDHGYSDDYIVHCAIFAGWNGSTPIWYESNYGTNNLISYRSYNQSKRKLYRIFHAYNYDTISGKPSDYQNPTINADSISITNISYQGYTLSVKVTDNVGVTRVRFPTWTPNNATNGNAQDDLVWHEGTKGSDGTTWSCRINTSQHNNENNCQYVSHIYAYDAAGNCATNKSILVMVPSNDTIAPTISRLTASGFTNERFILRSFFNDNVAPTRSVFTITCSGITKQYERSVSKVNEEYYADMSVYISDFGNATGTNYNCKVQVYDAAGNSATKSLTAFFPTPDTTKPAISEVGIAYPKSKTWPELGFHVSDDVGYRKFWYAYWPASYGDTYQSSYYKETLEYAEILNNNSCSMEMDLSQYNGLSGVEYIVQIGVEDTSGNSSTYTGRLFVYGHLKDQNIRYSYTGDGTDLYGVNFYWDSDPNANEFSLNAQSTTAVPGTNKPWNVTVWCDQDTTNATLLLPAGIEYTVTVMPKGGYSRFAGQIQVSVPQGEYDMGTPGPMREGNHKLYRIYKTSNTWMNARAAASRGGKGRFAIIDNADAQEAVSQLVSGIDYNVWIGGYGYSGTYTWYGGNYFFVTDFTNWDSGYPRTARDSMYGVQITPEGFWQSIDNNETDRNGGFILEYDATGMSVTCDKPYIPLDAQIPLDFATVTVTYEDGTVLDVQSYDMELSANEVGPQTLTVTYGELSQTLNVTVFKPMDSPDFILPESLNSIEAEAFNGGSMQVVKCPEGLSSIGSKAFANCAMLQEIYIPAFCDSIANDAFQGCGEFVIYGEAGSLAEQFAKQKGYAFIPF